MLKVEHLDVFYGDLQTLWDVSFEVKEGEIVVLLGANGAGKSHHAEGDIFTAQTRKRVHFVPGKPPGSDAHLTR